VSDYTVTRSKSATLGEGADHIFFESRHYVFGVTNLGGDDLYLTFDGPDPVFEGDESHVVLAGAYREFELLNRPVRAVNVISDAAINYVVEALI